MVVVQRGRKVRRWRWERSESREEARDEGQTHKPHSDEETVSWWCLATLGDLHAPRPRRRTQGASGGLAGM